MKKGFKYFGLIVLTLLVITGCGKKDPKDQLTDALKKTQKIESASVKVDAKATLTTEGASMDIPLVVDGEFILGEKAPSAHANVSMTLMGQKMNEELYMVVDDGKSVTYEGDGKEWKKTTEEFKADEYVKELKEMREKDIDFEYKSVTEVKTDKKGYTKLEVVIDAEKMNAKLEEAKKSDNAAAKEVAGEIGDFKFEKDIKLTVYLKNGYVAIIEYDLSDLADSLSDVVGKLMAGGEGEAPKLTITAKLTIELDKHNKVSEIKVPEEVITSATTANTDNPNNA